jgi:hypothetical protein
MLEIVIASTPVATEVMTTKVSSLIAALEVLT